VSADDLDRLALIRGVISALVGAVLIVYAVIATPPNRAVLVVLGLILLGVVAVEAVPTILRGKRDQ
jgi:hypothetical protein